MYPTAIVRNYQVPPRSRVAFWTSVASALALLMTVRLGTLGAAGFVGLWMLYILAWPKLSADAMLRTYLPWMFPLFALASMVWSAAPSITARGAVEWLAMTGIATVMVANLPAHRLLASWMLALIPIVIASGALGGQQFTETGEVATVGIFGSKNNFALHISEMFYVSVAVLADRRQHRLLRCIALLGVAAGPALLWRARSVGALVVFVPSLLVLCTVIGLGHMSMRARRLAIAGLLTFGLATAAVVAPLAVTAKSDFLATVGKSEDLTGRGLLWLRAGALIAERPLAGVGYGAFWLQENPEAEALWRAEHIASRGGFHFHSFYYEILVELGYTGLAVGLTSFAVTCLAVWIWALRMPGPDSAFFAAIMLFFLLRSFVELDLAGGFGMAALLLPAGWLYATSARRRAGGSAPQPQMVSSRTIEPGIGWWSEA
jgi:exopolysaccharide production protein ExoQ